MQITSLEYLPAIYNEFKFWSWFVGAFFFIFKGIDWFKKLKDTDLKNIQTGVVTLKDEVVKQTGDFVKAMDGNTSELKELRGDIKLLTAAFISPPRARAARAAKRKK